MNKNSRVLVLGAAGYVGSRLIPRLLDAGYRVKAAARSAEKLKALFPDDPRLETVSCDAFHLDSLTKACIDRDAVFYLIHSMRPGQKDFENADRTAAQNMAIAAEHAGVKRILYLGGLGDEKTESLSKHLRSRREVELVLQGGTVPVTVLRAAMIIGAGSASFEILRYLVERLPVMITPRWVITESQPIAIRNVLHYLTECLSVPATEGQTLEIGGAEILNYRKLMEIYAEEARLWKRIIVPVPVLTPRLSSYWIQFVTPIHSSIAKPLAEGLRNKVTVRDPRIRELIPQRLIPAREAIRLALDEAQYGLTADTGVRSAQLPPEWTRAGDPAWAGGTVFEDKRKVLIRASASKIWKPIAEIGGETGWYYADWLWQLRGAMDAFVGGVGMRKGRKRLLEKGGIVDFWMIEKIEPEKRLLLSAQMKLPGSAVLDFRIIPEMEGTCRLEQTARFIPRGLAGILYWQLVSPFHHLIFRGMLKGIVQRINSSTQS